MASSSLSSKSCADPEVRLPDNSSIECVQVCPTHNPQRVQQTGKASPSNRLCFRNAQKRGYLPSARFAQQVLQQMVSNNQTRKKWRPVIDLSVMNSLLHVPTFKMETAEIIRNSLTKGEWLVSIDLKDAYFHVPIHPDSQHLLCFHIDKRTYQFKALPFGLATTPLTPRVHADCKRSKPHSLVPRNSSSPIPGRLVVKSKYQTPVPAPDKRTHPYDSRTRLCDKLKKIRA